METEDDHLNPTDAMKERQRERWRRSGRRLRPPMGDPVPPIGDVLTRFPGGETKEDRQRQRQARAALLQDRAHLERLFRVDFTEAARAQFEERYGADPLDWTATVQQEEVVYGLNPQNFSLETSREASSIDA